MKGAAELREKMACILVKPHFRGFDVTLAEAPVSFSLSLLTPKLSQLFHDFA